MAKKLPERFVCDSCGGEYSDLQKDGSEYYHACPPDGPVNLLGQASPIANPRNENVKKLGLIVIPGTNREITQVDLKSAGQGRTKKP